LDKLALDKMVHPDAAAADCRAARTTKAATMKRPLTNHSCQIPKLTSPTEKAAATLPAIIA
jgi:hypothetical protein